MAIVLSVDAMGGDHGVNVTVPACLKFLKDILVTRCLYSAKGLK